MNISNHQGKNTTLQYRSVLFLFLFAFGTFFSVTKAIDTGKVFWFVLFTFMTCLLMLFIILLAVRLFSSGAPLEKEQKKKVWNSALTIGLIFGILFFLFSPNMADTDYDYIINGVRISDRAEDFSSRFGGGIIIALLIGGLIYGIAALILKSKILGRQEFIFAVLFVVAIAAGIIGGRAVALMQGHKTIISEEQFLEDPASARSGNFVEFGAYPQNGTDPEPILWRVMEKEDGQLLLMSEYALDTATYSSDMKDHPYAESLVRQFLKYSFVSEAFNDTERSMLVPVSVGNGETDTVTLLTNSQAEDYFGKYSECPASENVKETLTTSKRGDCSYFLRPDDPDDTEVYYYMLSELYTPHTQFYSFSFDNETRGVRPVILIAYDEN